MTDFVRFINISGSFSVFGRNVRVSLEMKESRRVIQILV